jgi:hypothetical protein
MLKLALHRPTVTTMFEQVTLITKSEARDARSSVPYSPPKLKLHNSAKLRAAVTSQLFVSVQQTVQQPFTTVLTRVSGLTDQLTGISQNKPKCTKQRH